MAIPDRAQPGGELASGSGPPKGRSIWTSISAARLGTTRPKLLAENLEEAEKLLETIRELPEERQQLLVLKFVERLSNAEIGEIMNRTEGAIKSLYHRTLLSLRDRLEDEDRAEST